jgi:uncharacterized protein (DUF2345 family)
MADAADKATAAGANKLPHMADPNIALVGKAGIGITAGQDWHLSSQDTTQIASGQDTHWAVGGQVRVQTAQGIGVLAGAIQPGAEAAGKGITLIAAQGPIDLQAQAGPAQIAAKQTLELKTASGVVNIAAAKRVVMAVTGGASVIIEGDNVIFECPGKITVRASQRSMVGPQRLSQDMPGFPTSTLTTPFTISFDSTPFGQKSGWAGMPYKVFANGAMVSEGVLDEAGDIHLKHAPAIEQYKVVMANGMTYEIPVVNEYRNSKEGPLAASGVFKGDTKQGASEARGEYQEALNARVNTTR